MWTATGRGARGLLQKLSLYSQSARWKTEITAMAIDFAANSCRQVRVIDPFREASWSAFLSTFPALGLGRAMPIQHTFRCHESEGFITEIPDIDRILYID